jgi:hypothetical protein
MRLQGDYDVNLSFQGGCVQNIENATGIAMIVTFSAEISMKCRKLLGESQGI